MVGGRWPRMPPSPSSSGSRRSELKLRYSLHLLMANSPLSVHHLYLTGGFSRSRPFPKPGPLLRVTFLTARSGKAR